MTEVVTDADARNKRRLPAWMLPVNAADKVKKSARGDEKCSLSAEETKIQAAGSKIKPVSKKPDKSTTQEAKTKQQAESLQGCESKLRTKKATRREEGPKASFTTCGGAKKRRKTKIMEEDETVIESTTTRKQHVKGKRRKNSEVEVVSPERSDEEILLTVEDLLCIAEETLSEPMVPHCRSANCTACQYVSADKEKQYEQQAAREISSKSNTSGLPNFSKVDMEGALQAGGSSQILSKCSSSSRSSHLIENTEKEMETDKDGNIVSSITSTGDAAQDMLNLYLGPLLKNSTCVEPSVRAIESEGLTSVQTIESNVFPLIQAIESKGLLSSQAIQSKGLPSLYELDKQVRSCAISKEEAPLMKKKSSLKDKVAMFLD